MSSKHLVDPELLPAVENFPPLAFSRESLHQVRQAVGSLTVGQEPPAGDGICREERLVAGPADAPDVRVLVLRPEQPNGPLPAVLYIHGGGYILGRPDQDEPWCRELVARVGCVVVAPDYRKAPETAHPGPIGDCYAVLKWMHAHARELGIDASRIAVEGVSAGGGLAAALTLLARDRQEVSVAYQILDYPMMDDRTGRPGGHPRLPYAGEFVWTYDANVFGWDQLLGEAAGGSEVSPYAAAARATDLAGLPPAFIAAAALDVLAPENIRYGLRLIEAGVPTELHVYPGTFHGFDVFDGGQSVVGNAFRKARVEALQRAFARGCGAK